MINAQEMSNKIKEEQRFENRVNKLNNQVVLKVSHKIIEVQEEKVRV